jgi:hypothetical protein
MNHDALLPSYLPISGSGNGIFDGTEEILEGGWLFDLLP